MKEMSLVAVKTAHPVYGCIDSSVNIVEYPVAASQYFYHAGEAFVYLDANGRVTKALTATATLFGFAITPVGRGAGASDSYWLSSANAGADTLPVIVDLSARYLLPADATVTQAMCGNACDIIAVNDGTATQVDVGTSSTDVLLIQDLGTVHGGVATDVVVKINPAKVQADT